MPDSSHPLDRAIALTQPDPANSRRLSGLTSADYWNANGPFGGITAANLLQAVLRQPDVLGAPLSLTVSFAAAVREGAFELAVRLVRAGRTTQHWAVDLLQGESAQTMASALVSCGLRRPGWGDAERGAPPAAKPPRPLPHRPGDFPGWLKHFRELRLRGELFTESADSESLTWIADAPDRALDFPALVAHCDAFFPRLFMRLGRSVPVATVSMNIHFLAGTEAIARQGSEPMLAQCWANAFEAGFYDQQALIWGLDDRPLATTQQMVWYRE